MRAQHHRTQHQPGANARRRPNPPISAIPRLRSTRHHSRRKSGRGAAHRFERRGQGARVLWSLMMVGGLIASGFVLAQRSQINAHQLRQAEEKFKTQLDEMTNQQRFLVLEKERATNAHESARVAQQAGLSQPQWKKAGQAPVPQAEPAKPATAQPAKLRTDAPKPLTKPAAKPATKPAAQPVKSAKPMVRPAMARVPATASAPPKQAAKANKPAPAAKANKDGKNPRQLAQNSPPGKKDKRR